MSLLEAFKDRKGKLHLVLEHVQRTALQDLEAGPSTTSLSKSN